MYLERGRTQFLVPVNAGYLSLVFPEMLLTSSVFGLHLAFAETLLRAVCCLVPSFIISC